MSADPSPVSLIHEGAQSSVSFYSGSCSHLINNPRFTNPFGQSNSSNRLSTYTRQHQFRLSDHSNMRHQSESHSSTAVSSEQFASSRSSFGDSGSNAALSPLQAPISQHLDQFQTSQAHPGDLGMVPRQEQMSPVASPVAFTYGQRQTAYPWSTAAAYPTSTYSTHTDPLRSPCHVQELGTEWAQKVSFSSQGFYPYSPDPQHLVSSTAAMTLQAVAQTHLPSGTASMGLGHLSLLSPHDSREERSTTR